MGFFNINGKNKPVSEETILNQQSEYSHTPDQQALTERFKQLPAYQQYMQVLMQGSSLPERSRAYSVIMSQAQQAGIEVPEDMRLGMDGAVRDMTWAEKHPKLFATIMVGASLGGLAAGGAAAGAFGGATSGGAVTGAALGPTTAGSMAATTAAAGGSTIPAALAPTIAGTAGTGGALTAAGRFLNSPAGASLVNGGLQAGAGILNNNASAADAAAARKQQLQILMSQITGDQQADNLTRDTKSLDATQMDPVAQQKDIFRAGVMRVLAAHGAPQVARGGVTNPVDLSGPAQQFLGDDQLAGAAQRFYTAAGTVSNNSPTPDLAGMGFKGDMSGKQSEMIDAIMKARKGREDLNTQRRNELTGTPMPVVPPPPTPVTAPTTPTRGSSAMLAGQLTPNGGSFNSQLGSDYFTRRRLS